MSAPKVSVIVPVYNTQKYLKRALDSITNQSLRDIEIIIVDDGSKEECARLCDTFATSDERIKVIHKKNAGLGFARNTGLEAASGEYVGFVDSDDYIDLSMYEVLYDTAKKNNADIVISGICFVGGNMFGKEDEFIKKNYFDVETIFRQQDMKNLLFGVIGALPKEPDDSRYGVSVCKNIFKRELICQENSAFLSEREVLSEDTLFMVDFIKRAKVAVGVPDAFYCYCRNEDSLSKSYKADRFEKSMIFLGILEEHLSDFATSDEYGIYLDRLTQGFGRILCSQEIVHAISENIKFSTVKKRLNEICSHDRIRGVLKKYPWHKLPVKQAAFAFTMRYRLFFLQKLLVILRDR